MRWTLPITWLLVACSNPAPQSAETAEIPDEGPEEEVRGELLPYVPFLGLRGPSVVGTLPIQLTDVSEELGLAGSTANSVAFVDYDDDGWPDLTTVDETGLRIYRNEGGVFKDRTHTIVEGSQELLQGASQGAWFDADGDGVLDLYLARRSMPDQLLLGDGNGHVWLAKDAGLVEGESAQGVSFADVDNDGDLDAYVVRGRRLGADMLDPPLQNGYAGRPNHLLINDGGRFTDRTAEWGATAGEDSESFVGLFADMDRDGDSDLMVVRDFRPDHYFTNNNGLGFSDTTAAAVGDKTTSLMGLAVGDYNGDGHLDLYATNDTADRIFRGRGDGTFEAVEKTAIVGGDPSVTKSGWGCALVDLDNDGDQDVITIATYEPSGQVGAFTNSPARIGGYVVLENLGDGTFKDITSEAGLGDPVSGSSLAVADFDLDGDMDVAVGLEAPREIGFGPPRSTIPRGVRILRNDSAKAAGRGSFLLGLRAPEAVNSWGIGAIIDVTVGDTRTSRVVTAGESHLAQSTYVQHFGLSTTTTATVKITWPDGTRQTLEEVPQGYHPIAKAAGACCVDDVCDSDAPKCGIWAPPWNPCGIEDGCTFCGLLCERLAGCGDVQFDCAGDCAASPPHPAAIRCALSEPCATVVECLTNFVAP